MMEAESEEAEEERSKKRHSFLHFFRKNVDESVIIESKQRERAKETPFVTAGKLREGDSDSANLPRRIKSPKHIQLLMGRRRWATEEDKENGDSGLKPKSHYRDDARSESQ
jgi:hypothetical protein